jgi:hypothetical protein
MLAEVSVCARERHRPRTSMAIGLDAGKGDDGVMTAGRYAGSGV